MAEPAAAHISEAMNRLWLKFLPQMEERVETLQSAAAALEAGSQLSPETRSQAGAEAHKLAGVLGTFGLKEGTELAREAEGLFEGAGDLGHMEAGRLVVIAQQLKTMIASRI